MYKITIEAIKSLRANQHPRNTRLIIIKTGLIRKYAINYGGKCGVNRLACISTMWPAYQTMLKIRPDHVSKLSRVFLNI